MGGTNTPVPTETMSPGECRGVADILATVGDKWTVMIVGPLSWGPLRYKELQRRVAGISQRMLTLTLKRLEADGLVTRTLYPSVPPRVDYELTELGHSLRQALVPVRAWAAENRGTIEANRARSERAGAPVRAD